jgi:hypothetical protein
MRLCYEMDTCSLRNILQTNHGVPIYSEFRKKTEKKVKLEKNWIVTPDFYGNGNGSKITTEVFSKAEQTPISRNGLFWQNQEVWV